MKVTYHRGFPLGLLSLKVTSRLMENKMLVNVKKQTETRECHLSSLLFRGTVNSSVMVGTVNPNCIGFLTLREVVGFQKNSDILDTHNSNIQGVLKTCMYM